MDDRDRDGQRPLYSIGSVARLVGLSPGTLRNWEARYGILTPTRTSVHGQRLYAQSEIDLVRVLAERVGAGAPIRKAVAAIAAERQTPGSLALALRDAVQRLDGLAARRAMIEAAAVLTPTRVWSEVAAPTLRALGDHWAATGEGIAAEHLATEVIRGWLQTLLFSHPVSEDAAQVVVAGGPNERHDMGSLMLTIQLRERGVPAIHLGVDTPLLALADALSRPDTRLLVAVATTPPTAESTTAALVTLANDLATRAQGSLPTLAYGGPAFATAAPLHEALSGRARYLGHDLAAAADTCRTFIDTLQDARSA